MKTSQHRLATQIKTANAAEALARGAYNAAVPSWGARALGVATHPLFLSTLAIPFVSAGWEAFHANRRNKAEAAERVESFKNMMLIHPTLQQKPPGRVQLMFNTLARANPVIAGDPNAAGAYIRRSLDEDGENTGAGVIALVDMATRGPDVSKVSPRNTPSWQSATYVEKNLKEMAGMTRDAYHEVNDHEKTRKALGDLSQKHVGVESELASSQEREKRMRAKMVAMASQGQPPAASPPPRRP